MAGHPLRSATDRRLGEPLPHQPANQTRVHLIPPEFFTPDHAALCAYAALAAISNCYSPVWGRLPTRYSPVRRSVICQIFRRVNGKCFARLACVKHAASVHPEPGSNSLIKCLFRVSRITTWLSMTIEVPSIVYPFYCFGSLNLRIKNVKEFSIHVFYCSVIKVPVVLTALIFYHIIFSLSRTFLKSFFTSHSAVLFFFFDSHTRLSHLYCFVKNFLKLFSPVKTDFLLTLSVPCSEEHFAASRTLSPRLSDIFVLCDS